MKVYYVGSLFTKDTLSKDVDYQTYPDIAVSCAVCGETISFVMNNFDKYTFNTKSRFSPEDIKVFDEFIAINQKELSKFNANSFLDYYCPRCKTPIRIYFQWWGGGRWTSGYKIWYVIE